MAKDRRDLSLKQRLALYSARDGACLRWQGSHSSTGYGLVSVRGSTRTVHRVAYELAVGPIPAGLVIDHVVERGCQFRDCIEPTHLEAITQRENIARGRRSAPRRASREARVCIRGHDRTDLSSRGQCQECRRQPVECPTCGLQLNRGREGLIAHMRRMHNQEGPASICFSRKGEYDSHLADSDHICTRCGALDEDALTEELRGLRQELDEARAERDRAAAEALRKAAQDLHAMTMDPFDLLTGSVGTRGPIAVVLWLNDRANQLAAATPDAEPAPRTWAMPDEPGPEVTRLSAVGGDLLLERDTDDPKTWLAVSAASGRVLAWLRWPQALGQYSPLIEASAEPARGVPVDTEARALTTQPSTEEKRHA